ncbi:MAG: carboxypeptidase-like regulatory domain-containing protein [Saprospiraceae bacterium]|nr:carboxypeptidase-like regulatory domain-containing protein [Saprospiraceae bacterium]
MYPKIIILLMVGCWLPKLYAQKPPTPKSPEQILFKVDTLAALSGESSLLVFKQSSISPDTAKAMLRVRVMEEGNPREPLQGATVLLRRDNDKMLGRVTKHDGRCLFSPTPAAYTVRVQMTGLKTLEKSIFVLEAGKVYDMEIVMARN